MIKIQLLKTTHLVIVFIYFVHQSYYDIHLYIANKVMQGLRNKYPAFSSLISIAEHSKKETSSISRNTSTSGTNVQLIKIKVNIKVNMLNATEVWRSRTLERTRTLDISYVRVLQGNTSPDTKMLTLSRSYISNFKTVFLLSYI